MARYISLLTWTDQGVKNIKETLSRAIKARESFSSKGAKITDIYWTLGQFDLVVIFEAPTDETATQLLMGLSMQGNVRSTTLRAFNDKEMESVMRGL
jgi:uncharacterized protein with GYD domain